MDKAEIVAVCIEEIRNGKSSIDDCVTRFPEMGKNFRPLLEIALHLRPEEVTPTPEFKERVRYRLYEEMRGVSSTGKFGHWVWPKFLPAKVLISVLIGLFVLGGAGGTVFAAQRSLPGDVLYPVKTGTENIQMALTTSAVAKANLHIKLAQRRIDETTRQIRANQDIDPQILAYTGKYIDDAIKELSNVANSESTAKALSHLSTTTLNQQLELSQVMAEAPQAVQPVLEKTISAVRRGNIIAQVAYTNHDFLKRQPSVSDEKIESAQFKIDGILRNVSGREWNVDGIILDNVDYPGKTPAIGSQVRLEGIVKENETFISQVEVTRTMRMTMIEGQFSGTNANGTANIGGISVRINSNSSAQLKTGENIRAQVNIDNGELNVTGKEDQHSMVSGIRLNGVLAGVSISDLEIKVRTTGNQLMINVSEARIEDDNGKPLTISDLKDMVSRNIRVDGVYKRGKLLFARRIQIGTAE